MAFDSSKNAFQLYSQIKKLPFAMSRHNWTDDDVAIVTGIVPKGKYGDAFGFAVRDGEPNDHFAYNSKWVKSMELPNAGSYQWRLIPIPDATLNAIVRRFYEELAPRFGFTPPAELSLRQDPDRNPT